MYSRQSSVFVAKIFKINAFNFSHLAKTLIKVENSCCWFCGRENDNSIWKVFKESNISSGNVKLTPTQLKTAANKCFLTLSLPKQLVWSKHFKNFVFGYVICLICHILSKKEERVSRPIERSLVSVLSCNSKIPPARKHKFFGTYH